MLLEREYEFECLEELRVWLSIHIRRVISSNEVMELLNESHRERKNTQSSVQQISIPFDISDPYDLC